MVKAIKGALLTCDPAVKTIVMDLDSTLHFIIEDLGDANLFIDAEKIEVVRARLEDILEENTYRVDLSL